MYRLPEQFRDIRSEKEIHGTSCVEGHGIFRVNSKSAPKTVLLCIAANGLGWEHVSISARHNKKVRIPTWEEMCQIKDLFWDDEDVVVQYHPKKSEYVSNAPVLHLWRPAGVNIPTPPPELVGVVGKSTLSRKEAESINLAILSAETDEEALEAVKTIRFCDICGEQLKHHDLGEPGHVFIDGVGMVSCEDWARRVRGGR